MCKMTTYDRFFKKVLIGKPDQCWIWTGGKNRQGYGVFAINRKSTLAHRVSFSLHVGPISEGMMVCHSCDNPSCVNPDHLWLGTAQDNTDDMFKKGRGKKAFGDTHGAKTCPASIARGARHGSKTHPESRHRGIKHVGSRLTERDVASARAEYFTGKTSYRKLAKKYNVSAGTMYQAINKHTWKHV